MNSPAAATAASAAVKEPAKRERKKPVHIGRAGDVRVKVYRYADGRFCVAYTKGGKLTRETFVKKAEAIACADERAIAISNGRADVLELTNADRDSYLHAVRGVQALGVPLHVAVEEWAAAKTALGSSSLMEAVQFYLTGQKASTAPKLSGDEVRLRLVASISEVPPKTAGEYRYRQGLRNDLERFCKVHPRLEETTAQQIRDYLRSLGVGPRRRDNIRDEIVTLFRFAKTKDGGKIFPPGAITEAELVKRLGEPTAITTYSAEELALLLQHVAPRWLPWMAIAAFSGLRPTEILRLNWSAFKWHEEPQPVIAIPGTVARKTKSPRRAELGPTLRGWLVGHHESMGALYPCTGMAAEKKLLNELSDETTRLSKVLSEITRSEWKWKNDALRHSYGSYRYAQCKDFVLIAAWMGNSVQTIKKRYFDSKSEQEGNAWFSVLPDQASNVIEPDFASAK